MIVGNMGQPFFDPIGTTLWVSHYLPAVDGGPIFPREIESTMSDGASTGFFMNKGLGPDSNFSPVPGRAGEGLYYAIDHGPVFKQDIFLITPQGTIARADVLDTTSNDIPFFVTRDGCHIYLGSNRSTPLQYQLYVAVRGK